MTIKSDRIKFFTVAASSDSFTSFILVPKGNRITVDIVAGSWNSVTNSVIPGGSFTGTVRCQKRNTDELTEENLWAVDSWSVMGSKESNPVPATAYYRIGIDNSEGDYSAGEVVGRISTGD